MCYDSLEEGQVYISRVAQLTPGASASRAHFDVGDACSLDHTKLGTFDAVLASNLLCRLPRPRKFLESLSALVKPGGVAVIVSPYSWLTEYTPRE
ncbi:unnamed protein product, partial [Choristocarpus tenellus]